MNEFVMNFRESILKHLIIYKQNNLGITKSGFFKYQGNILRKDHILPNPNKYRFLNIIPTYRDEFKKYLNNTSVKLHRFFHHLNSSQALCFNLFFPLIVERKLHLILDSVEIDRVAINYEKVAFEKRSSLESNFELSTMFDFYFELNDEIRIYFEIKYTENGFGKAKKDEYHIRKYERTYKPILQKHRHIDDKYKNIDFFLANYQIMRNLIHIKQQNYVVFIYPLSNEKVHSQIENVYNNILIKGGIKFVKYISLENLTRNLIDNVGTEM